ncbi:MULTISPECIES: 3-oxoacyl-[acyl-carrier-protein] synthase III C-terminal domain-containing protein [unclassified Mesorhizobium]|uniref:3-oxoacyl-ACP synthase III family protein n=1 Tax=unclassified Mesorhizobium TaxID=325217 RepID=UPI000FCBDD28|nr:MULTISPECIES: 3-oxoacyl-[acyl-carrier-protein] synthase III C-terminal domain-containing protein [unclassified Mesorhizobium]TGP21689.1 ketoacyl-ACP synthase III [Mesorhizobium sp. M1D.F.Ca.ET.231.01.1.1]TGP29790.1 ketoacyl-ACP synthase III [Mesorhizobium sp. M1D.F.Ca.ET.234.01.1.1]TGS44154.1 ketoacyl-ACP synthase III [Mesorhizobium sp. M1D.F.Ca.ET.184.01.1.1]TGS60174.1 ketoacyl-ACP synthase III [Mesorhizobium sp. M1D.F.Ca.ET.183.01.1.1]
MRIRIVGTGSAVPARCVTTCALEEELGLGRGALEAATGVVERYVCEAESQIDLACAAARVALEDAGLEAEAVDLIIGGCGVPYQPLPATAPLVMRRLGLADGSAAAFDVNSTCLGFLTAFETAGRTIDAGQCETALVFSAEVASRALPWREAPEVAALFGDGAAAAVLRRAGAGEGSRVAASLMRTYPSGWEACGIGAGGTRFDFHRQPEEFAEHSLFHMDGKELFRLTSRHFSSFVADLLERAGWRHEDIDLVVPHQASPLALAHMARQTGFAPEKLVDIAARFGNQIAASIPFALDIARREGRVAPGMKLLVLGTSAGVSFGGMALEA